MLIKPTAPRAGSHRLYTLPPDTRVLQVLAAHNVHPISTTDSVDWDFEADGQYCCIWKMHHLSTYSAYAPLEVLVFLGLM